MKKSLFSHNDVQRDGRFRTSVLPLEQKFAGTGVAELRRLRQLDEENNQMHACADNANVVHHYFTRNRGF